ncbi:Ribonuclease H-like domain-containing protein [Cynara cardunculus var. scolymus]|uniref:RBR-type E3 ubiquitin transferase n=1 Tax=Cynara cardunculus var. scolymus TaxID=59895 RepID=A0A103XGL9_CYNCS|nr:Ribonuclease H-like domain-containing protein [Cynara cardunculus var. scolymus]
MDDDVEELSRIAGEQHREFMAARVVDSDLDLAFRLQLEEAISASLAFQPSSSTSPTRPQQPPSLVSDHDRANTVADLQTLEFERFETEIRDRVLIKAETKKLQADLHRRIHDGNVAREILHMPVHQWLEVGDNFERPYGEGSSSSSKSEVDSEIFSVYFKGLLSEERVDGTGPLQKTVTMAGIGVAICDSRDGLIFEMRKPLDLKEDDRTSRQSMEGKALIEALNAAIALDLKRIVLYCDYYTLYQYVFGRWQPKQRKMRAFVNQVNHLRKNFTYCVPALVARNDVKFAFKLAREAILSQITKAVESSDVRLENCVICFDDKPMDQFFSVEGCKHRYCFSCMKQHVEVKLLQGMVPKCPYEGCEFELKIGSCEIFMTPKLIQMMKQRLKEASIPVTDKIYCPYPKCSALMSKTKILQLPRFGHESAARTCYNCLGAFCMNCRVPWHNYMTCAEYKQKNPIPLVEESQLKNLAARNLWRQCGYEFCYTCGAEWKNKKATCNCPLWHEDNIMDSDEEDEDEEDFDFDDDDDDDDYDYEGDGYDYNFDDSFL